MSFGAELSRAKAVAGPPKVVAELAQKQAEVLRGSVPAPSFPQLDLKVLSLCV